MTASLKGLEVREQIDRIGRSLKKQIKHLAWVCLDLIREAREHRYFQSLRHVDWTEYQLRPIIIASVLINLLELSLPYKVQFIDIYFERKIFYDN